MHLVTERCSLWSLQTDEKEKVRKSSELTSLRKMLSSSREKQALFFCAADSLLSSAKEKVIHRHALHSFHLIRPPMKTKKQLPLMSSLVYKYTEIHHHVDR